ncbi:MAG: PD-(D/E)XK nuclease family protein, partial [Candidatus Eremiobacteraeota bacterium]|nr:PD-(D/E)XK nuclease family protein [Candidatus Eremiobacteraeota bacterium]
MESPEFRSFVDAALAWLEEPSERHVRRMLRSPYSGVAHEVAAAIVTLTPEGGTIAHTLASGRVALPAVDRDAVFAFTARLDALDRSEPTGRESIVCEAFGVAAAATPSLETPFELALQPPREPETSVTLRPRQSHFSASSLNAYVECARKWFYRYCCAAVEDKGSAASFYGTAFHAALEDFHGAYPHPSDASASELRTRLDACINTSFDAFRERFGSAIAFELQRRRARRTGRRYVDWLAAQAARAPFTVLGCELPAQMELEGYAFIGYI